MGKKIHSKTIIQKSKKIENYLWNTYYSEKKKHEFPLYVFITLEIKKFLAIFLKKNSLTLHNYKISFSESELKIFISYFTAPVIKFNKSNIPNNVIENSGKSTTVKQKVITSRKRFFIDYYLKRFQPVNKLYLLNKYYANILQEKLRTKAKIEKIKQYDVKLLNHLFQMFKAKNVSNNNMLTSTSTINTNVTIPNSSFLNSSREKSKVLKTFKINNFLESLVESLNIFIETKFNIAITLHQINKDINYLLTTQQLQLLKKITMQLRRYKESRFFAEGINLLIIAVLKKNVSKLLAQFIASHFKSKKKDNVFFKFLKQMLSLLFTNQISKIKSVKILIKGRFNGSRRTRKKLIFIGNNMPLMTLNSNINYSEATAYGPNGTFGVKVWVDEG